MLRANKPFSYRLLPLLILFCGLITSVLTAIHQEQSNQQTIKDRFDTLSQHVVHEVLERFHTYEYGLRGARGAVIAAGTEQITRERFLAYSQSRDQDKEFPGSRGYGFIRKIPAEQRNTFETAARLDNQPNFSITQQAPHGGDLFVIQYIEPEAQNWQAIGFDIASESRRRLAAMAAVRENRATLTKPITLRQANGHPGSGFLLLLPVFNTGSTPQTPEERWQNLAGWTYTPLVVNEVLADQGSPQGLFSLVLYDEDYAETPEVFYQSTLQTTDKELPVLQLPADIYGRKWLIEVQATPAFINQLNLLPPLQVGALLALISLLLAGLLHIYLANRWRQHLSIIEKSRLAAIVESSNDAIIGKNLEGVVLTWNKAAETMLGYSATEAQGKTVSELIIPEDLQYEEEHILKQIAKGEIIPHFQTRRHARDGRLLDVSLTVSPIRSADNRVIGAAKIIRDISEQKANEARILDLNASLEQQVAQRTEELNRARLSAEDANQAKSEFLSNMSHEIRSPLNAILGLVYLLRKQNLPDPAPQMIAKISTSGQTLLGIINDILDFSKIEAHRLDLESIPFCLDEVLDKLANIIGASLNKKSIEVIIEPAPPGANYLRGDALRLGQILVNLAGNAIKFTQQGEVVVAIRRIDKDSLPGYVRLQFSVKDTGIGIPPEKQQRIFDPFSQADTTTTRDFGGTGLGLSISRRLIEMMGGTLNLESVPGRGSTFSFTINFETSQPEQNAQREMTHQRLLIANDHETALDTLNNIAASLGWVADTVSSGSAVLQALQSGRKYDVILLDWHMISMNGLAALKSIRENMNTANTLIFILVNPQEQQDLVGLDATHQINGMLTKPVTSSSLFNAVNEAKHDRGLLHTYVGNNTRLSGLHLLVVDDSEINRNVAQQILQSEGALISLACNGEEALGYLVQQTEPPVDLVLMDVQMPVLDGYEVTRRLRANPKLSHLPVIALTAGVLDNQLESAMKAGMDDFVTKPFDVETLIATILRLTRQQDTLETSPRHPAPSVPPLPTGASPALLDRKKGLKNWGNEAYFRKHLQYFIHEHAGDAATILHHLTANEPAQACTIAHRLSGTAGSLAMIPLAAQAKQLESALHQNTADILTIAIGLEDILKQTIALITSEMETSEADTTTASKPTLSDEDRILLNTCLKLLDQNDPALLEPLLPTLAKCLSDTQLKTLEYHLDNFDFHSAEVLLQSWLDTSP